MYIEFIMLKKVAPGTLANKVTHVRQFLLLSGADLQGINHIRVRRAMDAVQRDKTYKPRAKPAIPINILRSVILRLPGSQEGITIRAAILTIYLAGLRQSEVAPHSVRTFRPLHHLTRQDVKVGKDIRLTIKHAKNLQKVGQARHVTLHPASNPMFCPVTAIHQVLQFSPTVRGDQAMFTYPGTDTPFPLSAIKKVWDKALEDLKVPPKKYSLHSIRKTASTTASGKGCSELEIQRYGGWSSAAHRVYITKTDTKKVTKALASAIQ